MNKHLLNLLLLATLLTAYGQFQVNMDGAGQCDLLYHGQPFGTIHSGYYLPPWATRNFPKPLGEMPKGNEITILGGLETDTARVQMKMTYELVGNNAIHFKYVFTPQVDMESNSIYANFGLEAPQITEKEFSADGQVKGVVPLELGENIHLFSDVVSSFEVQASIGKFRLVFDEPTPVLFQDNRKWGNTIGLRIGPNSETPTAWKGKQNYPVAFTITFPYDIVLERDMPVIMEANDEWIPLQYSQDILKDSALDFTNVIKRDAPAGKHGPLKAVGQNFEFANLPGVPQRFYGVNFCFTAHNITPEQSEILAERLLRLGYNAVRYHHYERDITRRDIPGDSTQLDPEKMAMFDAMFAAMKSRGLYATTDLFVSRPVFATEVWPDSANPKETLVANNYKRLCALNRNALENWKKFTRNFLTHVNPHTGLSYAQDPSLCLINLINEGTLTLAGMSGKDEDPRMRREWLQTWNAWLNRKYGSADARNKAWGDQLPEVLDAVPGSKSTVATSDLQRFYFDLEHKMFAEMKAFLKDELHCQALLTDMNDAGNKAWTQLARSEFDYVDDHFYVDHPSFLKKPWNLPSTCANISSVSQGQFGGSGCTYSRLLDKPMTITEFNFAWPGRYRGFSGILTGSCAAIQNWAGLWRFAYSHSKAMFEPLTPSPFDLAGDPLNQASERAGLCLFLRQDMATVDQTIAITLSSDQMSNNANAYIIPQWRNMNILAKVGTYVGAPDSQAPAVISVPLAANAPKAAVNFPDQSSNMTSRQTTRLLAALHENRWMPADNATDYEKGILQSLNGQLTFYSKEDRLVLDTPRTAGGFVHPGQIVDTSGITVTVQDTDATVWVSSLSDVPIKTASRLLLSHLTDLQTAGVHFNEKARKTVLKHGKGPILAHFGRASVVVKLDNPATAKVYVLDFSGKRVSEWPAKIVPEGLQIDLNVRGADNAQMLYEIVK